jgi:hypothetical protein
MRRPALFAIAVGLLAARAAHADVAVPPDLAVYGDDGLRVGDQLLYKGQVSGAALDAAQDLIWFASKQGVEVIDLRDPKRTPILIVDHAEFPAFEITGLSTVFLDQAASAILQIDLGKKPTVSAQIAQNGYAGLDPAGAKRARAQLKKARLVGGAWIKAQQGRKPRTIAEPAKRPDPPDVTMPAGTTHSDGGDAGGPAHAIWLGGTSYQLVQTAYFCGDSCYQGCVLYDPAKKKFAPLGDSGTWGAIAADTKNAACYDLTVDASGTRYYDQQVVCTLDPKQLTCTDLKPWTAFAWITASSGTP